MMLKNELWWSFHFSRNSSPLILAAVFGAFSEPFFGDSASLSHLLQVQEIGGNWPASKDLDDKDAADLSLGREHKD